MGAGRGTIAGSAALAWASAGWRGRDAPKGSEAGRGATSPRRNPVPSGSCSDAPPRVVIAAVALVATTAVFSPRVYHIRPPRRRPGAVGSALGGGWPGTHSRSIRPASRSKRVPHRALRMVGMVSARRSGWWRRLEPEPELAKIELALRQLERAELYIVSAINLGLESQEQRQALYDLHQEVLALCNLLRRPRSST